MTSTSLQYGFVTVLDCIQLLQHIVLLRACVHNLEVHALAH